jgi:hypothetical protein
MKVGQLFESSADVPTGTVWGRATSCLPILE